MTPQQILKELRKETPEIILFHSLSGKDSIVLLDMTTQIFKKVHCFFMYVIPDLQHMNKYLNYFKKTYKTAIWHEVPHFVCAQYTKLGHLGCKVDESMRLNSLSKVMIAARKETGLKWVVLGSKQNDGLSRRLQLRTYEHEAIDRKNFKCYPLSKWKNKDCHAHIKFNRLIPPQNYGDSRQSTSNNVGDGIYLTWVKNNFPEDFNKIISVYPESEIIQFRYENQAK